MNKVVKYLLQSAIPVRPVARAAKDVAGSVQRTGERLRLAKEALAQTHQRVEDARKAEQEELQLRRAERLTSAEIFQRWYSDYGWSEEGLESRRVAYRRAKFAWLIGAVLCLATMFMATQMHWLIAMLLICGSAIGIFAFVGKAFLDSLQEARINLRSMLTIREYVGRTDFFKRFLI
jgi:hypothetical protein